MRRSRNVGLRVILGAAACAALLGTVAGCGSNQDNLTPGLVRATDSLVTLLNNPNSTPQSVALYLVGDYSYNGMTPAQQAQALRDDWPGRVRMMGRTMLADPVVRIDLQWSKRAVASQSADMTGSGILFLGYQSAASQARFTSVRWVELQGSAFTATTPTLTDLRVNGAAVNALTGAPLGPVAPGAALTVTGQTDGTVVTAGAGTAQGTAATGSFTITLTAPATAGHYALDVRATRTAGVPAITTGLRRRAAELVVEAP